MKLLLGQNALDYQAKNSLFLYLRDGLFSLVLALCYALAWSFAALNNVGIDFSLRQLLPIEAFIMLAILILAYKPRLTRWLLLALIIAGGILYLAPLGIAGAGKAWISRILEESWHCLRWSFEITHEGIEQPAGYAWYIALLAAIPSYLFIWWKPLPFLLLVYTVFPFVAGQGSVQEDERMIWALAICLAGFTFTLARDGKLKAKQKYLGHTPWLLLVTILVLALALQSLVPPDFFKNPELRDRIRQMQKRMTAPEIVNYYEFSLRDAGYYPLQQNLGGPLQLNHQPYMNVTGPASSLRLRGAVSENYTGKAWLGQEMEPNYIFDNEASHGKQAEVFGYPSNLGAARTYLDNLFFTGHLTIEPLQVPVQVVFSGGRPLRMEEPENPEQIYYFNEGGQIYSGQEIKKSYQVESYLPKALSISQTYAILEAGIRERAFSLQTVSPRQDHRDLVEAYDPELAQLVYTDAGSQAADKLQQLRHIQEYLETHYRYELNVEYPQSEEDFLESFFRTKEGYCTYFATAFAVLAREAGIRARYVEGFLVPALDPTGYPGTPQGPEDYRREVLNDAAHAWIEVYLEGFGWLPLDATPKNVLEDLTGENQGKADNEEAEKPSESTETSATPSTTPPPTQPSESLKQPPQPPTGPPPVQPPTAKEPPFRLPYLLIGLLLALGLFLAYLYYCQKRFQKRHDPQVLQRQAQAWGQTELLSKIWQDMGNMYRLTGHTFADHQTLQNRFYAICDTFGLHDPEVFLSLEKVFYAEENLSMDKLQAIWNYYARMEDTLKQLIKKPAWFRHRFLFPKP